MFTLKNNYTIISYLKLSNRRNIPDKNKYKQQNFLSITFHIISICPKLCILGNNFEYFLLCKFKIFQKGRSVDITKEFRIYKLKANQTVSNDLLNDTFTF